MQIITDAPAYGTPEWQWERDRYIGASDVPAILGLSPWAGPWTIWARKSGRIPATDKTLPMRVGSHMESLILQLAAEETGWDIRPDQRTLAHDDLPRLRCHLDGLVVEGGRMVVVEAKTAHPMKAQEWRDAAAGDWHGSALAYRTQVQTQLEITGAPLGLLAVLSGYDLHLVEIEREPAEGRVILDAARAMLERIDQDRPPVPTAEDNDGIDGVREAAPTVQDEAPDLDSDEAAAAVAAYLDAAAKAKAAAEAKREAAAALKLALGDYERARISGASVTYRAIESSRLDAKRLRQDHPDIAAEYTTTSTSHRLTVRGPR